MSSPYVFGPRHRGTPARGPATTGFLTRGYLLALLLAATVTLGAGWAYAVRIDRHAGTSAALDLAIGQRLQTQRLGEAAAALAAAGAQGDAPHAPTLERFAGALSALRIAQPQLSAGPGAPAHDSPALAALYFGIPGRTPADLPLDAAAGALATEAGRLWSAAQGGRAVPPAQWLELQAWALGPVAAQWDQAIAQHQAVAREQVADLAAFHRASVLAALVLLGSVGLLIFRPLALRVARLADDLVHESQHDALTGLLNRRALAQQLREALDAGRPVTVIAVDLDWFKEANDSDGHAGGDTLLQATAHRLSEAVRGRGLVGRLGGDEFAVFLHDVDRRAADAMAERLREALHRPVEFRGRMLRLGATLGMARAPDDTEDAEALMRLADEALMQAKQSGRGRIGRASADDAQRLARERLIRQALQELDTGQLAGLTVAFQPIYALQPDGSAGAFRSVEALARWQHPTLGPISPAEFVPVAQRSGQMPALGRRLWDQALREFAELSRLPVDVGRLSLNVSAVELAAGDLVARLETQAEAAGVPLSSLKLEITEEVLLARVSPHTLQQLRVLHARGVMLAMDDFGTGTSGLSQMLALPFGTVKIDRVFIDALTTDPRSQAIVRATVSMGHSLGITVVAEGIETAEQAAVLAALGCDGVQGYHFARPMSAGALSALVTPRVPAPAPAAASGSNVVELARYAG